jgi:hypothetical protein
MFEAYDPRPARAPSRSAVLGAHGSMSLPSGDAIQSARLAATEHALASGGPLGPSQQGFELATGPIVPGARIGRRRVLSDSPGLAPISRCLEVGDAVKDGAIQRRQFLGA